MMWRSAMGLAGLLACAAASAGQLAVADVQVDGRKLRNYELTWQQCIATDGKWQNQGPLTESLVTIGTDTIRQRQTVARVNGPTSIATTYFERNSLAPVRMELTAQAADGTSLVDSKWDITPSGYTGVTVRGGDTHRVAGSISSKMLHGGALGLPLATLPFQKSPLEMAASMMSFDATYRIIATWVGRETLDYGGQEIEAWLVDLEWHHDALGDVYPPGPDASGGRYWIVADPPEGFPYVPRYKTDTYAIEFIPGTCPDPRS